MTERDVLDLLAERHAAPAWAFLRHVANGMGGYKTRTADAVAMSLWPSRGLELHGFEVKVYRSDWQRELKDPAKADEIATLCHRWWVVADEGVFVQGDLLPQTWGLMICDGKTLRVEREAPLLTPEPLSWEFLAAVLRKAAEAQVRPHVHTPKRIHGIDPFTEDDARKLMARLERFKATVSRLDTDVQRAIWDVKRCEREAQAEREARQAEGG